MGSAPREAALNPTHRTSVRAILAAVVCTTVLASAPAALPAPSIGELRARVAQIQAEVGAIDDQVENAAEAYNGAVYELGQIDRRISSNRALLVKSNARLKATQEALAVRLRSAYIAPQPSTLQVLLSSGSVSAALAGVDAMNRVSSRDAAIVRSVSALRQQRIATQKQLVKDQAEAKKRVATRAEQRATVQRLLGQRQAVLSGAKGRLATMLEAERERERRAQAELQRRAREVARQPTVTPASPSTPSAPATPSSPATPSPPSPSVGGSGSARNAQAARLALGYLGVPYVWGGASPSGFDCSGLASYVYAKVGVSVPHYTGAIWAKFPKVTGSLQPGDMVFYRGLGHMGIYIGGGNMVHAPSTGDVVKITAMSSRRDYVGAVRP